MSVNKGYRIIDCRNRPPVSQYAGLFHLKKNYYVGTRSNVGNRGAVTFTESMELEKIGSPESMDLWYKEMDECGIEVALLQGRSGSAEVMTSEDLAKLVATNPKRMTGMAAVDLNADPKAEADKVYKAITEYGLVAANIEPGYAATGGIFYKEGSAGLAIDNPRIRPIAEAIQAAGGFAHVQGGMICGPDISYNNPPALDRFLALFPDLTVVMCHGGYPYVSEICCLMAKHANFYVVPDVYFFHPGAQGYQMNLNLLPEQFLYGSGYPFSSMKESVEDTIALLDSPIANVRPEVMENYLYKNAARLLKIKD